MQDNYYIIPTNKDKWRREVPFIKEITEQLAIIMADRLEEQFKHKIIDALRSECHAESQEKFAEIFDKILLSESYFTAEDALNKYLATNKRIENIKLWWNSFYEIFRETKIEASAYQMEGLYKLIANLNEELKDD